jgi:diaminopimelate decarboxylase
MTGAPPATFDRKDGVLACDGVSLEAAAAAHGTPLFVYSRAAVEEAYRAYDRAFDRVPHRICYAVKANGSHALLKVLAGLGAGADIVSGGELLAALRAGFPAERIVFSGVGKTDAEIALGVARGIGEFNAESEAEIARVSTAASAVGRTVRVSLRVNPDIDARSHPYISTGLRDNKFGVDIGAAGEILRRARRLAGIEISGVQCHIGSQITDLGALQRAAGDLVALSRALLADGFALRTVDIGGGLGIDYTNDAPPPVATFAAAVLPLLEGLPLTLLLEPGRSLVARAGVLVTRVVVVKENHGKRFVVIDAGMTELLRPALYNAYHRIEPVTARGAGSGPVDVVGPVCETADFLARGRDLPNVEVGELLAIRDVGAYGFSMASTYNMRPRAAEALVDGGRLRLIRRRETFDDMVRTEIVD